MAGVEGERMIPLEAGSGHEELREKDKVLPEVEPETMKPRKKKLRLWEAFCFL